MKISHVIALCSFGTTSAFVAHSTPKTTTSTTTSLTAVGRRQFMEAGAAALLVGAASSPLPAFALEDLSEPTPEEKEAAEVSRRLQCPANMLVDIPCRLFGGGINRTALMLRPGHFFTSKAAYEERLRRKAELQKLKAQPNNFSSGMKAELAKQKEMKSKSKEQQRNDLCEELGRGC
eukprot:scaffold768_cov166-Amphora_coffeaeformis.AAC.28